MADVVAGQAGVEAAIGDGYWHAEHVARLVPVSAVHTPAIHTTPKPALGAVLNDLIHSQGVGDASSQIHSQGVGDVSSDSHVPRADVSGACTDPYDRLKGPGRAGHVLDSGLESSSQIHSQGVGDVSSDSHVPHRDTTCSLEGVLK